MTTNLEHELFTAMREETDGLAAPPELVHRAARRVRRRRATLTSAGLTVVAAAAVIMTLVFAGPGASTTRPLAPSVLTAAEVQQRALSALADANVIMHVTIAADGGPDANEMWVDLATGNLYRHDDTRTVWAVADHGKMTLTTVNRADKRWSQDVYPSSKPIATILQNRAESLRSDLRTGGFTLIGHETIDGADALHLRTADGPDPIDVWVDATSFRTRRETVTGPHVTIRSEFQWLERTTQRLAMFTVTVPNGYTKQR